MEKPTQDTLENTQEPVTKERKKPNITPEDRALRAERMREMATKRNELLKKQKAERFKEEEPKQPKEPKPKTPRVKKEQITAEPVKEPVKDPSPQSVQVLAKEEKSKAKPVKKAVVKKPVKVKTLVIQSSSDSEDYCDGNTTCESESETEEVVYIAKTPKNKTRSQITKAKPPSRTTEIPVREPMVQKPDPIKIKFF